MQKYYISLFVLFSILFSNAQCDYTFLMSDTYGDGWNGYSVDLKVNGITVLNNQTLEFGYEGSVNFQAFNGQSITTEVATFGNFPNEITYQILDSDANLLATGGIGNDIEFGELNVFCPANLDDALLIENLPFLDIEARTDIAMSAINWNNTECNLSNLSHLNYKYQPQTDITLGVDVFYGDSNTFIHVFTSNSANPSSYDELEFYAGDTCGFSTSKTIDLIANENYYILIGNPSRRTHINFYDNDVNSEIINFQDLNFKNKLTDTETSLLEVSATYDLQNPLGTLPAVGNGLRFILDTNKDNEIQRREALLVKDINLNNGEINSIDGIQEFMNLKYLSTRSNNLTDLTPIEDLSLEILVCIFNPFITLDFSNNPELLSITCTNPELQSINVSQNSNLIHFVANAANQGSSLIDIDISNNTQLEVLWVSFTNLTSINTENNTNLKTFWCYDNNIDTIDVSQNGLLEDFDCSENQITQLDISQNGLLEDLNCSFNQITQLDASQNGLLEQLFCNYNQITQINVSQNALLQRLECNNNQITEIDLSQNSNLGTGVSIFGSPLRLENNLLTSLDLSNNVNLSQVFLSDNYFLEHVNLKNTNNTNINEFNTIGCPNIQTICIDDISYAVSNFTDIEPQTIFVEDCNSTTVNYNIIQGSVIYDNESDGCDANDIAINNIMVTAFDGVDSFSTFTNTDGNYSLAVTDNSYVTSVVELPLQFTSNPPEVNNTFDDLGATENVSFCIEAIGSEIDDLRIVILPIGEARPGFNTNYKIVYENSGLFPLNGSITLQFNTNMQQFLNATPNANDINQDILTFNYTDLLPFESREISLGFNTFPPPMVNSDDVLEFTASIFPTDTDYNVTDNIYNLDQIVVNSFDPNDKQVLQGETILEQETENYLDYIVRYQNTGSASAINVVITDVLDSKLEWGTLQPISASHDYQVQITNGNFVEFIFSDINLPPQSVSEELSQGFIAFRIKPKNNVIVGDIISGTANIFFDFNAPITTNTVNTEIVEPLSVEEFNVENVRLYPNPAKERLEVTSKQIMDRLTIVDINGRALKSIEISHTDYRMDVSNLAKGVYFIEIRAGDSKSIKKFVKN